MVHNTSETVTNIELSNIPVVLWCALITVCDEVIGGNLSGSCELLRLAELWVSRELFKASCDLLVKL